MSEPFHYKLRIVLATDHVPMEYSLEVPNREVGGQVLQLLYNAHYSNNHAVTLRENDEIVAVINCERLIMAAYSS